ncbi:MAG: hypothetical protein ACI4SG_00970 [Oligosphaeraceae bacterium]
MTTQDTPLTVHVFGKPGCAKCSMLNRRLDKMLSEDPRYARFHKEYHNVLEEDGLVEFCKTECLNPSRIPAMVVGAQDETGKVRYLPNPAPDAADPVCKHSRLYQFLGIQTDYSEEGKGLITPEMIQTILDEALTLA